jgi:hypothetical protein
MVSVTNVMLDAQDAARLARMELAQERRAQEELAEATDREEVRREQKLRGRVVAPEPEEQGHPTRDLGASKADWEVFLQE